jgi:hypothetical protein
MLAKTLPRDQDTMESELAQYAEARLQQIEIIDEEGSIVSIEERMTSFDAGAARESIHFMGEAFREIGDEIRLRRPMHPSCHLHQVDEEEEGDTEINRSDFERRRQLWKDRQRSPGSRQDNDSTRPLETSRLL